MDRSFIGTEVGESVLTIERGRLRFFAKAIGETDPVYTDLAAANAAGYADLPAPPTFLFAAELDSGAMFGLLAKLGVDTGKMLHGEQSFEYLKPVVAGDTVTVRSKIGDIVEKKGGALTFLKFDAEAKNDRGEAVARMQTTLVVRR